MRPDHCKSRSAVAQMFNFRIAALCSVTKVGIDPLRGASTRAICTYDALNAPLVAP
jgi:hypothetical protein